MRSAGSRLCPGAFFKVQKWRRPMSIYVCVVALWFMAIALSRKGLLLCETRERNGAAR